MIPIGDAVSIFFVTPAVTLLVLAVTLGEPIRNVDVLAAALTITGAIIITRLDAASKLASAIPSGQRVIHRHRCCSSGRHFRRFCICYGPRAGYIGTLYDRRVLVAIFFFVSCCASRSAAP